MTARYYYVAEFHCGRFLSYYASFFSDRDATERGGKLLGNTAECQVCHRWFAYVRVADPDVFVTAEAATRKAVTDAARVL